MPVTEADYLQTNMKPRATVSFRQQRLMRASIKAEMLRYRRCLALVPNLPADVVNAGLELFKTEAGLALWLCEPARALGGKIPMRMAQTRRGATQVTQVLKAISHGVVL